MARKKSKKQRNKGRRAAGGRRRAKARGAKRRERPPVEDAVRMSGEVRPVQPLHPPHAEKLGPALHVWPDGTRGPGPRAVLGLPPDGPLSADEVAAAFRRTLQARPPEQHPDAARTARQARDVLTDPGRALERVAATIAAPDPDAWGLPAPAHDTASRLSPEDRLMGMAALYTLVEDALAGED